MKYEALDIETIWDENNIAKPLCIAISANEKIHFKRVNVEDVNNDEILKFLLEKCSSKKIYYVHNLTFEIFVFLKTMIKNKVKFKIISSNKIVYAVEIWYKKKKIRLRCSYRLTMLSLKKLAEIAEIENKTIFPYKILNKELKEMMCVDEKMFNSAEEYVEFVEINGRNINTNKILEEYCKNDVLITKGSIIKYWKIIEENGLINNNNILTAAKLSTENYFKNNFVVKKKINVKYDRIIRDGYFGGRTEVFGNPYSDELILHYDWSGMYAQCMKERVLGGEIVESNIINSLEHPGFYWIKFEQNLEFPILPIKRNKLYFVNGVYEGWYWFEEILMAMEFGIKILEVKKTISAQYYDFFLKNFVEINDKIRSISPIHKQIGKNNNNAFYGRLGMNPDRLEEEIVDSVDDINNYIKIIENNGVFIGYTMAEKTISNVTISASITAKARVKLYRGMMEVIKNGGRVLYTDTDSIIAGFSKKDSVLDRQMGEVYFDSTKGDTIIKDGVFAMPKTYGLKYENGDEIVKIKGYNNKPDFESFKEIFYNRGSVTTVNVEWSKKDMSIVYKKTEKKTDLYSLDKRAWSHDLKKTSPLSDL